MLSLVSQNKQVGPDNAKDFSQRLTGIAIDNVKNHIRVNAVCPSWVDTPMMQASLERYPPLEAMIKGMTPLGRAAEPEEVADYVVFLCSPSASYINGTGLLVDAGLTLTMHT